MASPATETKVIFQELQRLGTAQNRKIYARHGVDRAMYGVSFAELHRLSKRLRTDHTLACALWKSGNHDARVLATIVADPEQMSGADLDAWASELDNYIIADAFSELAERSRIALEKSEQWQRCDDEWKARVGWSLLAGVAMSSEVHDDAFFAQHITAIEREIHQARNRVRDAMNSALIAIGIRNAALEKLALAAAERIGRVEVDHGETGCKTPDAVEYIRETVKSRGYRCRDTGGGA